MEETSAGPVPDRWTSPPPQSPTGRRADVEGLRIVAVLLVVVYHYSQAGVSGGVDVFLFLSGYFVLGGLARRIERGEAVGVRAFYRRTARRLLPLAWTAASVILVGAVAVAPLGDRARLGWSFFSSLGSVENWRLALSQVTYGAASTYLDPFQHFWSLSVQVQVFLAAPWVLLASAALWGRRRRPGSMLVPVAAVTTLAAGAGWWMAAVDQQQAYFSTVARAWEFLAGAVLALALPRLRVPPRVRGVLGWGGLVVLCTAGLLVDGVHLYPGPAALVPLGAASAIVVAGSARSRFGVDRLLGAGPLSRSGRYAYALYIWHWPVMSVWLQLTRQSRLRLADVVLVGAVTVLLTVASHHVVEKPLRAAWGDRRPLWRLVGVATGISVGVVSTWGVIATYRDVRWREAVTAVAAAADPADYPGVMSVVDPDNHPVRDDVIAIPVPQAATGEVGETAGPGCPVIGDDIWCVFGFRTPYGTPTSEVALVGSSHSSAWHGPVHSAGEELGWAVTEYIRVGCPLALGDVTTLFPDDPDWADVCNDWNDLVLDRLRADPPDLVVTTFSRPLGPDGQIEWVPQLYLDAWAELEGLGVEVVAIRANQALPSADFICLEEDPCAFPREQIYGDDDAVMGVETPGNVHVLDMTQYACTDDLCPSVIGNVRVYADQTHLTSEYGRTAAPVFRDFVSGVLEEMGRAERAGS